jgi:hypothetical protein
MPDDVRAPRRTVEERAKLWAEREERQAARGKAILDEWRSGTFRTKKALAEKWGFHPQYVASLMERAAQDEYLADKPTERARRPWTGEEYDRHSEKDRFAAYDYADKVCRIRYWNLVHGKGKNAGPR